MNTGSFEDSGLPSWPPIWPSAGSVLLSTSQKVLRPQMKTAFLLLAQYNGQAVIPIDLVCRDYFSHLTPVKLVAKISSGDIAIPLVRIENSQKCAKGVHLDDLASYLDARVEAARREMTALTQ